MSSNRSERQKFKYVANSAEEEKKVDINNRSRKIWVQTSEEIKEYVQG